MTLHEFFTLLEEITQTYSCIRERSRQLVFHFPAPAFYLDFPLNVAFSSRCFYLDPVVRKLYAFVASVLEEDFGHGLEHAVLVGLDAGALISIESRKRGYPPEGVRQLVQLAHCAALLHDVKRKEPEHAIAGAAYARKILAKYPLSAGEADHICQAIRNHEAFKEVAPSAEPKTILVSDCLYDADKFRWGPDNFMDTVWDMVTFLQLPLKEFLKRYPSGLQKIGGIRHTFRTETGQLYGPQFIDLGLAIGKKLYRIIHSEFMGGTP